MNKPHAQKTPPTDEYFKRVVMQLGLTKHPAHEQEAAVALLGENIITRATLELAQKLNEDELGEFEKLTGNNNAEAVMQFLSTHVPDFDALMARVSREEIEETRRAIAHA